MGALKQTHFLVEPGDYSRNQVLSAFMDEAGVERARLLPCMKKSAFKRVAWIHRRFLINDFFISDYDTFVLDRATAPVRSFKARKLWFRDWLNFRFSRYLLADTATHLAYWERMFGKSPARTLVVPVLANRDIYFPANPPRLNARPTVLFFGTYIPLQGAELIVDAIHRMPEWWGRARFRFIGQGQTFKGFRARVAALGLDEHVEIVDHLIPEQQLAEEIRSSDIVLGIFGSSYKAQAVVPNKVYQGLACARCVVTADTPAVREFFSHDDLCLVDRNPGALAGALRELLTDTSRREALAAAGARKFADLFEQTRSRFIDFVRQVERG